MNIVSLIIFTSSTICSPSAIELSTVLDETLQQFREEILTFQSESLVDLNKSFFTFYNFFSSRLSKSILQPFIRLSKDFKNSCTSFPLYNLEEYAARRLINICDEVPRFIKKVEPFVRNEIEKYYPNPQTMTSLTLAELLAKDYFTSMDKHLEFVAPIYNHNPHCVTPLLHKFMLIYKKPINEMIALQENRLKKMLSKRFWRDLKSIEYSISSLSGMSIKMVSCSAEDVLDTYGCVSSIVAYDCSKRHCGSVFQSMHRTLFMFKRIEAFHEQYERVLGGIHEVIKITDTQMLRWSTRLDKCLNE